MSIFSDADLDDFANLAEDLALKDTCEQLRDDGGDDDGEGGKENLNWPVIATVPCMLTRQSVQSIPGESIIADRLDGKDYPTCLVQTRRAKSLENRPT
jgi:hypothetical protein